ncbi:Signal transduction histidine-protein kinase AtoS [Koleobacter methoxysyntrophicus]|jgi:PAS domain S-box-containing protein|uniref:histidine kinase n=1 Tax=Koleobacter methoxysyntrophicus TaxID=2751313 RepID=A0A8A0RNE5_9FIRM|nr:ATP-binding protein [Koleobacter methoxysyntrophicus]QSQ09120.1 Signal transduction histidine-protein kinase AtoS [Koleobacter methoxysyntrophicus]
MNYKVLLKSYETVLDLIHSGIIIINDRMRIISLNRAARDMFKLYNCKVIGEPFNRIIKSRELSVILKKIKETGVKQVNRKVVLSIKNQEKIFTVNTNFLSNIKDKKKGYVIVFNDITDLVIAERNLAERKKFAAMGQMAAGIAHELRNPLTAIKGFSQYIKEYFNQDMNIKNQDMNIKEYLDIMVHETNKTNMIIENFLSFAEPEPYQKTKCNVNTLINEIINNLQNLFYVEGIRPIVKLSEDLPYIMVDPEKIKQALWHISQNAVDALSNAPIKQIRYITHMSRDKNHIVIKITDTGQGIPNIHMDNLFTPFFTTKENGTGLGLSISYRIIKNHNGAISVKSKPFKGASFIITLPVAD